MNIKEFRVKYPGYNDVSDMELSQVLHEKYYSDTNLKDFRDAFGVKQPGLWSDIKNTAFIGLQGIALDAREVARKTLGERFVNAVDSVEEWFTGRDVETKLKDNIEKAQSELTPEMQAALQKDWWDEENSRPGPAFSDPRAYVGGLMLSLPGSAVTMAPALFIGRSLYTAQLAAGVTEKAAAAKAATAAWIAGGITEGLQASGQTSREVREKILDLTPEQAQDSQAINTLMDSGMSFEQALNTVAEDASTKAMILAGVATGIFGGLGDRILTRAITIGFKGSLAMRIAKGAAAEGLIEEAPQSYLQRVSANIAMQMAQPDTPLTAGAFNEAVGGAVIGGMIGGGVAGVFGTVRRPETTPSPAPAPSIDPIVTAPNIGAAIVAASDFIQVPLTAETRQAVAEGYPDVRPPAGLLPPPSIHVTPEGFAGTQSQIQQLEEERAKVGLTEDVRRAQAQYLNIGAGRPEGESSQTYTGRYQDGGEFSVRYEIEKTTAGELQLVRVISDSDGTRTEHLTEEGIWARGRPAKTGLIMGEGISRVSGPERFIDDARVQEAIIDDAKNIGATQKTSTQGLMAVRYGQEPTAMMLAFEQALQRKGVEDAIQEPGAESIHARQTPGDRIAVGERDAQGQAAAALQAQEEGVGAEPDVKVVSPEKAIRDMQRVTANALKAARGPEIMRILTKVKEETGKAIHTPGIGHGPLLRGTPVTEVPRADLDYILRTGTQAEKKLAQNEVDWREAGEAKFAQRAPFYSELLRKVGELRQGVAPVKQWKGIISNLVRSGVKPAEIEAIGINDWLDSQSERGGNLTKEELLDFVNKGGLRVYETIFGGENLTSPEDPQVADIVETLKDSGFEVIQNPDTKVWGVIGVEEDNDVGQIITEVGLARRLFGEDNFTLNKNLVGDWTITRISSGARMGTIDGNMTEDEAAEYTRNNYRNSVVVPDQYAHSVLHIDDVLGYLNNARGELQPQHPTYQLPGGRSYRELVVTIPGRKITELPSSINLTKSELYWRATGIFKGRNINFTAGLASQMSEKDASRETIKMLQNEGLLGRIFRSGHWELPNQTVSIRFNERVDNRGKKGFFVEEFQNDVAEKIRKVAISRAKSEGLKQNTPEFKKRVSEMIEQGFPEEGLPALPFGTKTEPWLKLALKRMVIWATQNGGEWVAWTTGAQQVDRYAAGLRNTVNEIHWYKTTEGIHLRGFEHGEGMSRRRQVIADQIDATDAEINEILNREEATGSMTPEDVTRFGDLTEAREELSRNYVQSRSSEEAEEDQRQIIEDLNVEFINVKEEAVTEAGSYRAVLGGDPEIVTTQERAEDIGYGGDLPEGSVLLSYKHGGWIEKQANGNYWALIVNIEQSFPGTPEGLKEAEKFLWDFWVSEEGFYHMAEEDIDRISSPKLFRMKQLLNQIAEERDTLDSIVRNQQQQLDPDVDTTQREDELSDAIGKAYATQIIDSPDQTGIIVGENLTITNTGMAGFYNYITPMAAKKVLSELGGESVKTIMVDISPGYESTDINVHPAVGFPSAWDDMTSNEYNEYRATRFSNDNPALIHKHIIISVNNKQYAVTGVLDVDRIRFFENEGRFVLEYNHGFESWADRSEILRWLKRRWEGSAMWNNMAVEEGSEEFFRKPPKWSEQQGFDITTAVKEKVEATGGELPMFQRGEGKGLTVGEVETAIARVALNLTVPVDVFATPGELAAGYNLQAINSKTKGVYHRDKIGIVASTHSDVVDVLRTVWHEIFHAGLERIAPAVGEQYRVELERVAFQNENIRDAARDWRAEFGREYTDRLRARGYPAVDLERKVRLTSFEEALAQLSGENAKISGIPRFIAALQKLLRALNLHGLANWIESKTDAEALQLISRARGAVMGSEINIYTSDDAKFVITPSPPEFETWFEGSKVVNSKGNPLVAYHGTTKDFDVYQALERERDMRPEWSGDLGTWFTAPSQKAGPEFARDAAMAAASYAKGYGRIKSGANIRPVYLSIKNPVEYSNFEEFTNARLMPRKGLQQRRIVKNFKEDLIEQGYDGIVIRDTRMDTRELRDDWLAFFPDRQVRSAVGTSTEPRFSVGAPAPARAPSITDAVRSTNLHVQGIFRSDRVLNRVISKVNTPFHIAEVHPTFKAVYDKAQEFYSDISRIALSAADRAPNLLPRIESFKDLFRKSPGKVNIEGISRALYAGTFYGGGNPMEGTVWTDEELRGREQTGRPIPAELKANPLTDDQIKFYRQALASVAFSLEEHSKSLIYRISKRQGIVLDKEMSMEDIVAIATEEADRKLEGIRLEEEAIKDTGAEKPSRLQTLGRHRDEINNFKAGIADIQDKTKRLIESGYFPAMRFGEYFVYAEGPDKQQLHFGLYESKLAANTAKAGLQAQFPQALVDTGLMNKEAHKMFNAVPLDALDVFADHIKDAFGGDVDLDPIMQLWFRLATSERSIFKRELHRKGVPGFSDNIPRVLAAFTVSISRSAASHYHTGDMLRSVMDIKEGDLQAYATRYIRYLQDPQEESQMARSILANYYILGSIAFGGINLTQPVMVTMPTLSVYTSYADAVSRVIRAARDVVKGHSNLSGDEKSAFNRAIKEGVVAPQELHQIRAESQAAMFGKNLGWQKFLFSWGSIFSLTEQFNRGTSFIAAYRLASEMTPEQRTQHNIEDPYSFGKEMVAATQFTYNRANRPELARGNIGSLIFTFKQFSISYVELATRLYRSDKKAFGLMMMTLFAMAGLEGLPFAEDVEDLIDTIGERLGYTTNIKKTLRRLSTEWVGRDAAQIMLHGVSEIAGLPIDVSTRLGMHNLIPGTAMFKLSSPDKARDIVQILGPAASLFDRVVLKEDRLAILPKAIQDLVKANDMAMTGIYRDTRGRRIVDVTPVDAMFKGIGFQPIDVARESRIIYENQQDIVLHRVVKDTIVLKWAQGVFEKDSSKVSEAREMLRGWNQRNPGSLIRIEGAQIQRRVSEMRKTREQRFVKSAPREIRRGIKTEMLEIQ